MTDKQTYTILEKPDGFCPSDEPMQDDRAAVQFVYERTRQRGKLGFTIEHDDAHTDGAIAKAAAAYALAYAAQAVDNDEQLMVFAREVWPWDPESFTPKRSGPANVVRAGGLLIAEWQRRVRKALIDVAEMDHDQDA